MSGIVVSHCTLKDTTNGVRIKTWPGSPPSRASGIIFDDIIMDSVKNPIIIDQKYGSHKSAVIHAHMIISFLQFRSANFLTVTIHSKLRN